MPPRRVALRVAYDGAAFHGSQRQPGLRTVEGDLLGALVALGAVGDAASSRFLAASRTDRGVSAAGNVVALDTAFDPADLPAALNGRLADAWVVGVAEASGGFNPRASPLRRYRYFQERAAVADAEAFAATLALFAGEHDFSSFARVEAGVDPRRALAAPLVREEGAFLAVDFEGLSFLWNQVRRMVGAALAVAAGEAAREDVARALADPGGGARDFGLADPAPLVLLEVRHDLPWLPDARGLRRAREALARRVAGLDLARAVAASLLSESVQSPGRPFTPGVGPSRPGPEAAWPGSER